MICYPIASRPRWRSILDDQLAASLAIEVDRVLKSGGAILWYDVRLNNPSNPHTRPIGRRELGVLFPGYALHLHSLTLLPPLARRLGRLTAVLYPALAALPPLRSHLFGLLVKPAAD